MLEEGEQRRRMLESLLLGGGRSDSIGGGRSGVTPIASEFASSATSKKVSFEPQVCYSKSLFRRSLLQCGTRKKVSFEPRV